MTILETRFGAEFDTVFDDSVFEGAVFDRPAFDSDFDMRRSQVAVRRPAPAEVWPLPRDVVVRRRARRPQTRRPAGAPLGHHGTGVLMSRASHRRRPITPVTTVVLALIAAAITVWLGLVAQVGGAGQTETAVQVPTRLSVVEVQAGETLQHIASRVAPDAPVDAVVARIRELNKLDAGTSTTGSTLIAPIG